MNNENLFVPKSIAIVGASPESDKGSARVLSSLLKHGYKGKIYPINPKYEEIERLKCYPNLTKVPDDIDLAYITIPARLIFEVLRECVAKKVSYVIIRSSGFAETGEEGKSRQKEIEEFLRKHNIRLMGPNSIGFVNVHGEIVLYSHISLSTEKLIRGHIGLISQSGGMSGAIFNLAQDKEIGFSYLISTGSESDLDILDFMEYLVSDKNTKVIAVFMEGLKDGKRFMSIANLALQERKPLVIMKVGKTEKGTRTAASHTGALSGKDQIFDAAFKQMGIIRVESPDELYEIANLFTMTQLPNSDQVGIITSSGGTAVLMADQSEELGLTLPNVSESTRQTLSNILPKYSTISNPLDITGGLTEETFQKCLEAFGRDESLDLIVVATSTVGKRRSEERANRMVEIAKSLRKPLIGIWIGGSLVDPGVKILRKEGVPSFQNYQIGLKGVKALIEYSKFLKGQQRIQEEKL
jgi:acyl-CoA synthetase (NDP forming)